MTLNQKYFCQKMMLHCLMKVNIWDQALSDFSSLLCKHRPLFSLSLLSYWGENELVKTNFNPCGNPTIFLNCDHLPTYSWRYAFEKLKKRNQEPRNYSPWMGEKRDICVAEEGGRTDAVERVFIAWELLVSDLLSQVFRASIPTDVVFFYRSGTADKVIHQVESEVRVSSGLWVQGNEHPELLDCLI